MKTEATISNVRAALEKMEQEHGDLPIFHNENSSNQWQLIVEQFVVMPTKNPPDAVDYYPKRVTIKIYDYWM